MKLRISYSLLTLWRRGRYEDAVNLYLHKKLPTSQAMEDGNIYDAKVTEWVHLYKKLPDEFGGDELRNPEAQKKLLVPFNEICDLSILPDIIDEDTLWENKTGNSKDSGDYAIDFQVPIYFLGLGRAGYKIEKAIINHYNQYKEQLDRSLIWNTKQELERAENFINTLAPEIHSYFESHGILDKENNMGYNTV